MTDETILCEVQAKRKGRGQATCLIMAGYINRISDRHIVLRTEDADGISPIVALLSPDAARQVAEALMKAADRFSSPSGS